jgi:threonine dehydrogenase-like Zn-dependent dehydrogenase
MKALCWHAPNDVRVDSVPDPEILRPRDAIIKVTSTAICGSDLHLYDGYIPAMKPGDILGHEFMGEIVELGEGLDDFNIGERVVVPFTIACGSCYFCERELWSLCDNTNPNAAAAEALYGFSGSGLFGYSHLYGGYPGGQAQYARVPFADVGLLRVPEELKDEQVLFLTDILPTAYMAAENGNIHRGDTVAVWGCGPVGQLTIACAWFLGAARVIAIDHIPERLALAGLSSKAETINFAECPDVVEQLKFMTGGRGPDVCIDAVGMEAHGVKPDFLYDRVKHALRLETDRPTALREVIQACRKGGTVSIPGVYGGVVDKMPMGAAFAKGLTFRMGQTHVHRYMRPLLDHIRHNEIDPTFIITHRLPLGEAPAAYELFKHKRDNCIKVVLSPWPAARGGEHLTETDWVPASQASR